METVGFVGGSQLEHIPRDRWATLKLDDVMLTRSHESVSPQDTALSVLTRIMRQPEHATFDLPVIADGQLIGLIGQAEIARFLHAREQGRALKT